MCLSSPGKAKKYARPLPRHASGDHKGSETQQTIMLWQCVATLVREKESFLSVTTHQTHGVKATQEAHVQCH